MLRVSATARWTTLTLVLAIARVNGNAGNSSCANFAGIQCKDQVCLERNVNLTLKPDPSYDGGSVTLTARLNDSHNYSHLLYLFCYDVYVLDFVELGCVESNFTNASLSFTWNFTGNTSASVYVFNDTKKQSVRYNRVGCVVTEEIDVGANKTANVSVKVSEENRPENKTAFYAGGNVTINASAVLFEVEELESSLTPSRSGCCDDPGGGYQTMMYTFCYMRNNGSKTKTVTTNLSYALFVDVFEEVNHAQSFTVKLNATNKYENVAYHGNLTTKIDVIERVHDPVFTINNNKTVHKNDVVLVNITVYGSFPISVVVDLRYLSDSSDHLTHNCTTDFPISGTITGKPPSISNYCQFNRTGKFQLDAKFENNASAYQQNFDFTISDGPPPVVVASSTIAVVVVVVLLVVVVLSIIVIFVYVPYQSYKKRVTETANFSFIDLQKPTRWERFKIKLENWKNRLFRRDSRLGLINYSDVEEEDLLSNLYGSVNPKKS